MIYQHFIKLPVRLHCKGTFDTSAAGRIETEKRPCSDIYRMMFSADGFLTSGQNGLRSNVTFHYFWYQRRLYLISFFNTFLDSELCRTLFTVFVFHYIWNSSRVTTLSVIYMYLNSTSIIMEGFLGVLLTRKWIAYDFMVHTNQDLVNLSL